MTMDSPGNPYTAADFLTLLDANQRALEDIRPNVAATHNLRHNFTPNELGELIERLDAEGSPSWPSLLEYMGFLESAENLIIERMAETTDPNIQGRIQAFKEEYSIRGRSLLYTEESQQ